MSDWFKKAKANLMAEVEAGQTMLPEALRDKKSIVHESGCCSEVDDDAKPLILGKKAEEIFG